jgi:tRNA(Ile2) C34 agmatinyltransferase TiaS
MGKPDTSFLYARFLEIGQSARECPDCGERLVYDGSGYTCLACSYRIKLIKLAGQPPSEAPGPNGK